MNVRLPTTAASRVRVILIYEKETMDHHEVKQYMIH